VPKPFRRISRIFEILTPVATTTTTTEVTEAETEPPVQYQEIAVETPEIEQTDVSLTLEAEDTAIPEYCSVAIMPRLGYSGTGYLSNRYRTFDTAYSIVKGSAVIIAAP